MEDLQIKLQKCSLNDSSSSSSPKPSPGTSYFWKRPEKTQGTCNQVESPRSCSCQEKILSNYNYQEGVPCSSQEPEISQRSCRDQKESPRNVKNKVEFFKNCKDLEECPKSVKIKEEFPSSSKTLEESPKNCQDRKVCPCKAQSGKENPRSPRKSECVNRSPQSDKCNRNIEVQNPVRVNTGVESCMEELYFNSATLKTDETSEPVACRCPEEIMKALKKRSKRPCNKEQMLICTDKPAKSEETKKPVSPGGVQIIRFQDLLEETVKSQKTKKTQEPVECQCNEANSEIPKDQKMSTSGAVPCKCLKEIMKAQKAMKSSHPDTSEECPCADEIDVKWKKPACQDVVCQCSDETSKVKEEPKSGAGSTLMNLVKDLSTSFRISKDSGGVCSLADSTSCTCDASARAQYYHNKLLSTLQILQNKEETIRVQTASLAEAEARISALTDRATDLRREVDRKTRELQVLRKTIESYKVEKADVCVSVDRQEMDNQSDIVSTLQNNLSVIEELYRECFYETAKQESLIDMLRNSYLDVRLMEKQKSAQVGRLQTVIDTQKWSLDRCQDIAVEVDNLKMEISNFLSSSTPSTNNDSGMWERSEDSFATLPGVQEELQDMMAKLLTLRDLLNSGCVCGLEQETMRLKKDNKTLEKKVGELSDTVGELQYALDEKDKNEQRCIEVIEQKEKEMQCLKKQIAALHKNTKDQTTMCDTLSTQLDQVIEKLDSKNCELQCLRQQYGSQEETIKQLKEELEKAGEMIKENCKIQSTVTQLTSQVSLWRAQLQDSEARARRAEQELARATAHCQHIDECYREKASTVAELQAQLEEAHARSAALCEQARGAVRAVRRWARRMRTRHKEQERLLKEKEVHIRSLQQRLQQYASENVTSPSCPKYQSSQPSYSKYQSSQPSCSNYQSSQPACSKCQSSREQSCSKMRERTPCSPSASETGSQSSAPIPPKRVLRKKALQCGPERRKRCTCDVSSQQPLREDAAAETCSPLCPQHGFAYTNVRINRITRDVSPSEELFLRVKHLSEALEDGHRRWTRPRDQR